MDFVEMLIDSSPFAYEQSLASYILQSIHCPFRIVHFVSLLGSFFTLVTLQFAGWYYRQSLLGIIVTGNSISMNRFQNVIKVAEIGVKLFLGLLLF